MTMDVWTTDREKTFVMDLKPTRSLSKLEVLIAYRKTLDLREDFGIVNKYDIIEFTDNEIRRLS